MAVQREVLRGMQDIPAGRARPVPVDPAAELEEAEALEYQLVHGGPFGRLTARMRFGAESRRIAAADRASSAAAASAQVAPIVPLRERARRPGLAPESGAGSPAAGEPDDGDVAAVVAEPGGDAPADADGEAVAQPDGEGPVAVVDVAEPGGEAAAGSGDEREPGAAPPRSAEPADLAAPAGGTALAGGAGGALTGAELMRSARVLPWEDSHLDGDEQVWAEFAAGLAGADERIVELDLEMERRSSRFGRIPGLGRR